MLKLTKLLRLIKFLIINKKNYCLGFVDDDSSDLKHNLPRIKTTCTKCYAVANKYFIKTNLQVFSRKKVSSIDVDSLLLS